MKRSSSIAQRSLVPLALAEAQHRLADFIEGTKSMSHLQHIPGGWSPIGAPEKWDVSNHPSVRRMARSPGNRITLFFTHRSEGQYRRNWPALPSPLIDFTKALVATKMAEGCYTSSTYFDIISGIRLLYEVTGDVGHDPSRFTGTHFHLAEDLASGKAPEDRMCLRYIHRTMERWGLTAAPMRWHPRTKRWSKRDTLISSPEEKAKWDAKLPSPEAIGALSEIWRDERLRESPCDLALMAMVLILLATGIREGELLSLPADCLWSEPSGSGLNPVWYLGRRVQKGGYKSARVVDPAFEGLVQEAASILTEATSAARESAAWMEARPGRVAFPGKYRKSSPETLVSIVDLCELLGNAGHNVAWWLDKWGIRPSKNQEHIYDARGGVIGSTPALYRLGSVERCLRVKFDERKLVDSYGNSQLLSSRLLVFYEGFFNSRRSKANPSLPRATPDGVIGRFLCGAANTPSIFERYKKLDGRGVPHRITSHQFRHLIDTLAHLGGMPDTYRAMLQGRSQAQNHHYVHLTLEQALAPLRQLSPYDEAIRIQSVLESDNGAGYFADRYRGLPDHQKARFLDTFLREAYETEFGHCLRSLSLNPCDRMGACIGCRHWMVERGNQSHLERNENALARSRRFMDNYLINNGAEGAEDPPYLKAKAIALGCQRAIAFISSKGTLGEAMPLNPNAPSQAEEELRWE